VITGVVLIPSYRDTAAIHAKLDEIIISLEETRNDVVGLEHAEPEEIRDRLWKRVQERAGPAPKGMKRLATQWVKPGIIGRVEHLRGEEDLRHASLQDFREDIDANTDKGE